MGTITGTAIITRAQITLLDDATRPGGGQVTWNRAELPDELFEHLKAGLRAIVIVKPDAFVVNAPLQLVAGIKQALPVDATFLIDIRRNLGTNGTTPGAAIISIPMTHLDNDTPGWPTDPPSAEVLHYMYDARDPKTFYIYPAQPAMSPTRVEAVYGGTPTMANAGVAIPIDDVYDEALYNFVLAHAWAKNTKRGDYSKANNYMAMFQQILGLKSQAQFAFAGDKPDGINQ